MDPKKTALQDTTPPCTAPLHQPNPGSKHLVKKRKKIDTSAAPRATTLTAAIHHKTSIHIKTAARFTVRQAMDGMIHMTQALAGCHSSCLLSLQAHAPYSYSPPGPHSQEVVSLPFTCKKKLPRHGAPSCLQNARPVPRSEPVQRDYTTQLSLVHVYTGSTARVDAHTHTHARWSMYKTPSWKRQKMGS